MVETKDVVLERTYTIPLRKEILKAPYWKRAKKAIKAIRKFLARHMKVPERDESKIKIDVWVNRAIWIRGAKKPPYKITVKAIKDKDGNVKVEFVGLPRKYKVEEEMLLKKIEKERKKREEKEKAKKKKEEEKKKEEVKKKEKERKEKKKEEEVKEKILRKETEEKIKPKELTQVKEKQEIFRKALEK